MLNGQVYYHGIVKKCIIAFGRLFSDIYIDRKTGASDIDTVNGTTVQRLRVPLAYAPKEKWLVRIDEDKSLENHTLTQLPRMSFEIIAYTYDSLRKINRMQQLKSTCPDPNNPTATTAQFIRTPVPYNIDMSLYIITKTQEDALQIMEQILPTFTPEYTMTINAVESMGVELDVPIVLNSVIVSDEFEGDFQTRRFVIHTINFQMKISLFGAATEQGIITNVNTHVDEQQEPHRVFTATGDPETRTVLTQEWIDEFGAH